MRALTAGLIAGTLLVAGVAQAHPKKNTEPTFKNLGHIHGYLVNAAGEGLYGIVALESADGAKLSLHETERMRSGRFDIDNLLPGHYKVHAQSLGPVVTDLQVPADVEVDVHEGQISRPRLVAGSGRLSADASMAPVRQASAVTPSKKSHGKSHKK